METAPITPTAPAPTTPAGAPPAPAAPMPAAPAPQATPAPDQPTGEQPAAQSQAPAPSSDAKSAPQPDQGAPKVDPAEFADALLKGAASLPKSISTTSQAMMMLAKLTVQDGKLPQEVSDSLQRIGIVSKLTDTAIEKPDPSTKLPEELTADPAGSIRKLEAQLLSMINKLSTSMDAAPEIVDAKSLSDEQKQQFQAAASIIETSKMAAWAAVKLVPVPEAAKPESGSATDGQAAPAPAAEPSQSSEAPQGQSQPTS